MAAVFLLSELFYEKPDKIFMRQELQEIDSLQRFRVDKFEMFFGSRQCFELFKGEFVSRCFACSEKEGSS